MFILHEQLAKDGWVVGDFPLCRVLMMDDSQYPWLILVPRQAGLRELYELDWEQQQQYLRESNCCCQLLVEHFFAEKLNVAALGNMVPQLHIHHIARCVADPAWPRPVWGALPPQPYTEVQREQRLAQLRERLTATALPFAVV